MNDIKALREQVKDLKVLFVDDEEAVREGTGTFLKKFFDNVVVCSDGQEGLNAFSQTKDFDVIITDILMPVMDGVEMSKEIRKIDPNAYIIFLTASRTVGGLKKGLSNITLQKPLSFEDMIRVMNMLGDVK